MGYKEMVASKTVRELMAMKSSLESSADDVGCFSADDPELLQAVERELERRAGETAEDYWDCQCEGFCLHSKFQDACQRCGSRREYSPHSRVVRLEEEIRNLIRVIQCLKDDDVQRLLDEALSPEMKSLLAGLWS